MNRSERIASAGLVAFGLGVAYHSHQHLKLGIMITPGAGYFPFWIGIALAVLGVLWFLMTLLARKTPESATPDDAAQASERRRLVLARLVPGVLLVLAYAWLFERAGYFLSTVLFMVGWQKGVEREGWLKTAVVALLCAAAMYALFSFLLKGVLPTGAWFS
ncbi:MAG: tripartite tricarboxylate transporter TctB family protein [Betaproteobacteria bacterium]|nr:tripartite tricarboxylate transporter TctB family protein [Betaproteobacteria bacterium]